MKIGYRWMVISLLAVSAYLSISAIYGNFITSAPLNTTSIGSPQKPVAETFAQNEAPLPPVKARTYVPILMYHYIRDYKNDGDPLGVQLSVSPATFDKQLAVLSAAGYQTISLQDFVSNKYQSKPVIITFDDGYEDQSTIMPILEKYHYKATFFIVSSFIGRPGYMTKEQIGQLAKAGMEIGGHTVDHKNLATMLYEKAVLEISKSMVDRDPVLAYPSGQYNLETLDIVSALGIKAVVTTKLGVATEHSSRYELPRIRVKEGTDLLKIISQETAIAKQELPPSQRSED